MNGQVEQDLKEAMLNHIKKELQLPDEQVTEAIEAVHVTPVACSGLSEENMSSGQCSNYSVVVTMIIMINNATTIDDAGYMPAFA